MCAGTCPDKCMDMCMDVYIGRHVDRYIHVAQYKGTMYSKCTTDGTDVGKALGLWCYTVPQTNLAGQEAAVKTTIATIIDRTVLPG